MKTPIIIFCFLILSGCATTISDVDNYVGADQPKEYKIGYKEGCDSGYRDASNFYYKFKKDVRKYSQDDFYRQGWNDGHLSCFTSYNQPTY